MTSRILCAIDVCIEEGLEEGRKIEIAQGREEGIQQGIQVLVGVLRKVGKTDEEILQLIMEESKLEREKVLQYL